MYRLVVKGKYPDELGITPYDHTFDSKEKADASFTVVMNELIRTAFNTDSVHRDRLLRNVEFTQLLVDGLLPIDTVIPQMLVAELAVEAFPTRGLLRWLKAPVDDEEFKNI